METATRVDTEARLDGLLEALTLEEQVLLLAGANFWMTVPIERHGIPAIKVTDGPNGARGGGTLVGDRKSTRLNSSHVAISYAVFCLKKKKRHIGGEYVVYAVQLVYEW